MLSKKPSQTTKMTAYIYKCASTWTVTFHDKTTFSTTDQSAWEELRAITGEFYSSRDFEKFPEMAPSDPKLWLELFQSRDYYTGDVGSSDEGDWEFEGRKYEGTIVTLEGGVVASTDDEKTDTDLN
jgi:hypothetical protein